MQKQKYSIYNDAPQTKVARDNFWDKFTETLHWHVLFCISQ